MKVNIFHDYSWLRFINKRLLRWFFDVRGIVSSSLYWGIWAIINYGVVRLCFVKILYHFYKFNDVWSSRYCLHYFYFSVNSWLRNWVQHFNHDNLFCFDVNSLENSTISTRSNLFKILISAWISILISKIFIIRVFRRSF